MNRSAWAVGSLLILAHMPCRLWNVTVVSGHEEKKSKKNDSVYVQPLPWLLFAYAVFCVIYIS